LRGPRLWLAQAEYREQTDTREDCVGGKAENQSRSANQSLYQSECDSEQPHRQDFRRPTDQTCFLHEFRLTASARLRNNDGCAKQKPLQLGGRNGLWQGTVPCSHRDDCAYALGRLSNQSSASARSLGFLEEDGRSCIYSDRSRHRNPALP